MFQTLVPLMLCPSEPIRFPVRACVYMEACAQTIYFFQIVIRFQIFLKQQSGSSNGPGVCWKHFLLILYAFSSGAGAPDAEGASVLKSRAAEEGGGAEERRHLPLLVFLL